ncbi:MAG: NADH-quinone oxidoreductase subunit L [Candidatus Omnitrophica bacterium]|nr:NADH-quinone oxidoreductase subunit L [Candidatus Omnitrophota bacterium]
MVAGRLLTLAWVAWFAPLAACLMITLVGLQRRRRAATLAVGSLLLSFLCAVTLWWHSLHGAALPLQQAFSWIRFDGFEVPLGILLDPLSILMLLVVTGVGSAIFIYSTGYMHDDPGYPRYFACLSLFAFAMLGIVLADNWITLFISWELVGLASYLLIGFWYQRPAAADAGKKAFMVNRVADFGFLLGILLLWSVSDPLGGAHRTFALPALKDVIEHGYLPQNLLNIGALLIFCGVLGKSAQMPLHVWLPDAMEGPTPVSALIHAATMVAAGVYLLCRVFFLFDAAPIALSVVAWVGGITAFLAGCMAFVQNDLKRILAYSTLSQLGYMVMAAGLGGPVAAMYHLTTHACFKALLFLGAGSVIHALHEQEIWKMGGLLKTMPVTGGTFLIGAAALAGFPGLSGFWSKDEILALAWHQNWLLCIVAIVTAGLTALYMGRACFVVFFGQPRSHLPRPANHAGRGGHAHESPPVMTVPLVVLAVFTIIAGYLGIPEYLHQLHGVQVGFNEIVAVISVLAMSTGLWLAYQIYYRQVMTEQQLIQRGMAVYQALVDKLGFDTFYDWLVLRVQQTAAKLCSLFERFILIGTLVNGTGWVTRTAGGLLRLCQTGRVQFYVLVFLFGMTALIYVNVLR